MYDILGWLYKIFNIKQQGQQIACLTTDKKRLIL